MTENFEQKPEPEAPEITVEMVFAGFLSAARNVPRGIVSPVAVMRIYAAMEAARKSGVKEEFQEVLEYALSRPAP